MINLGKREEEEGGLEGWGLEIVFLVSHEK